LLSCFCCSAQGQVEVDTLSIKQKADSIVHLLQTEYVGLDSTEILLNTSLELYRSIDDKRLLAYSFFGKSIMCGYRKDYVSKLKYMDSVIMYKQYLAEEKDIFYFGYKEGNARY